jgi:hypothetical protein
VKQISIWFIFVNVSLQVLVLIGKHLDKDKNLDHQVL